MTGLSLTARPKINLFLHVTGRRPDGYHLLESLVIFPAGGDELYASEGEGLSLTVTGPFAGAAGPEEDNLALRAATMLRDMVGIRKGVSIWLVKNLPVAAGLGGGSADAAAVLHLLGKFWKIDMSDAELQRIGLELGADVPACIFGEPAIMSGIGEILTPVSPFPELHLLLVNSGVKIPTGKVFSKLTLTEAAPASPPFEGGMSVDELIARLQGCRNDLYLPALEIAPEIATVLEAIEETDGCRLARMSGSGASCFGLYGSAAAATGAAEAILARHPGWWVKAMMAAN